FLILSLRFFPPSTFAEEDSYNLSINSDAFISSACTPSSFNIPKFSFPKFGSYDISLKSDTFSYLDGCLDSNHSNSPKSVPSSSLSTFSLNQSNKSYTETLTDSTSLVSHPPVCSALLLFIRSVQFKSS